MIRGSEEVKECRGGGRWDVEDEDEVQFVTAAKGHPRRKSADFPGWVRVDTGCRPTNRAERSGCSGPATP